MQVYTTIKRIKAFAPCSDGMAALLDFVGADFPEQKKIYFADVLKGDVNISHIFWGLRAAPKSQKDYIEKALCAFACDCAERVLPIYEKSYPTDKRPRSAIKVTRKWLRGEANDAARDEARAAAWDAARDAARDAAWTAARDAAWAAARAAARAAAWDAARDAARDAAWAAAWAAAWKHFEAELVRLCRLEGEYGEVVK